MNQIVDKTGTLNCTIPTLFGHILQHVEWGKEYLNWENVQEEFRHCADVLYDRLCRMNIEPIIENDENYCGILHSKKEHLASEWESIFNYQLYDAAVSYCFAAAENGGNQEFAAFGVDLFNIVWRLRRDLEITKRR